MKLDNVIKEIDQYHYRVTNLRLPGNYKIYNTSNIPWKDHKNTVHWFHFGQDM